MESLQTDGIPLHYQVKQLVRELIESGAWAPGTQIPTELDLCQRFGVSRPTVRQALQALVNDGLLVRQRGRGTFVCSPRFDQPIGTVYSLTQLLVSQGVTPMTRILELTQTSAKGRVAAQLRLPAGSPVWKLRRLRLANGVPILLDTTWLPVAVWRDFDPGPLQKHSIYDVLTLCSNRHAVRAQETMEPVIADDYEAAVLEYKAGRAALLVERTTYDETDTPVEFTKTIARGDRMRLTINLGEFGIRPQS